MKWKIVINEWTKINEYQPSCSGKLAVSLNKHLKFSFKSRYSNLFLTSGFYSSNHLRVLWITNRPSLLVLQHQTETIHFQSFPHDLAILQFRSFPGGRLEDLLDQVCWPSIGNCFIFYHEYNHCCEWTVIIRFTNTIIRFLFFVLIIHFVLKETEIWLSKRQEVYTTTAW